MAEPTNPPADGCGCQYDVAGRRFRTRCICPSPTTPEQTLRGVAGLGGAIGDAVRDLLTERDELLCKHEQAVQDWAGCRERLAEVAAERDQARFNHATTLLNLDLAEAGRDALQDQVLVLQGQAGDMAKEIERLRETIEELLDEREAFGVTGDG